jgi:hypothetical protein
MGHPEFSVHRSIQGPCRPRPRLEPIPTPVPTTPLTQPAKLTATALPAPYYIVNSSGCQNCARPMRRYPDGRLEVVVADSIPRDWTVDEHGRLGIARWGRAGC